MDIRVLDRRALALTAHAVAWITPDQLDLPTPCEGWRLRDLMAHLVVQNTGFAASARSQGSDLAIWQPGKIGDDVYAAYLSSAADVSAAFAAEDVPDRRMDLPEFGRSFPAEVAIGFHVLDYVVHAWDVAATLGVTWEPAADLVEAVLPIAEQIPDTPPTRGNGGPFAHRLPALDGMSARDRLLTLVGRTPGWAQPSS